MTQASLPSDTLVVFAYAQAGLGHMRVADAIFDGMPQGTHSILLSSRDKRITYLHRITSIHPLMRRLLEFLQNGWPEDIFTRMFRYFLARGNAIPREELTQILNQSPTMPKTILIIATHFGLAHQFALIKEEFAKAHGIRVVLVVVVTDDSPQKAWAVPGADLIFCPSTTTKVALAAYHHKVAPESRTVYFASPYMVTPKFILPLSPEAFAQRQAMYDPLSASPVTIAIPVSGAAVQLGFLLSVASAISNVFERFRFEVVCKESMFTSLFLYQLNRWPRVTTHISPWDRIIIEMYEDVYTKSVIGAEITKPSEQAFKALCSPREIGGSILLFSEPVGRQERDNLRFFQRHGLIPSPEEESSLWDMAERTIGLSTNPEILAHAQHWRGIRLPANPQAAAKFIAWTFDQGIWAAMGRFSSFPEDPGLHADGVARFWEYIAGYLQASHD